MYTKIASCMPTCDHNQMLEHEPLFIKTWKYALHFYHLKIHKWYGL